MARIDRCRRSPGECLWVSGQTGCVPSIVSGKLSAQVVRGHTLAEGACGGVREKVSRVISGQFRPRVRKTAAEFHERQSISAGKLRVLTQELGSIRAVKLNGCAGDLAVALQSPSNS